MRLRAVVASTVLALAAAAAVAAPSAPAAATTSVDSLQWHDCEGGFECSTLTVPLDYSAPDGPTIGLAVIRRRARHPSARVGSLVINPGGPGAPADAYLRGVADSLPGTVQDRFDLVSFDPRGVGNSSAVDCQTNLDALFDQSFSPVTSAQRAGLTAAVSDLAAACATHEPALLPHLSTADAARDLDRLRAALGEARLNFVGFSYGTSLGARYASAYPDRVRAFVLDGAIDPTLAADTAVLDEARGFEHSLNSFLANCSAQPRCTFHQGGHAARAYDALRDRAADAPLAVAGSSRVLNQTRFDAAVLDVLYDGRAQWPALAAALQEADDGDASTLLGLADAFVGRTSTGGDDHSLEAFWAITCLDGPVLRGLNAAAHVEAAATRVAPRLGAFIVNFSLPCSVWPVPPLPAPEHLTAAGASPILVIGTTQDPATPLVEAQALARELHDARLLVVRGERHTAFLSGNECVDGAVSRYLVSTALPAVGARC